VVEVTEAAAATAMEAVSVIVRAEDVHQEVHEVKNQNPKEEIRASI
jgi:hypothetical protein